MLIRFSCQFFWTFTNKTTFINTHSFEDSICLRCEWRNMKRRKKDSGLSCFVEPHERSTHYTERHDNARPETFCEANPFSQLDYLFHIGQQTVAHKHTFTGETFTKERKARSGCHQKIAITTLPLRSKTYFSYSSYVNCQQNNNIKNHVLSVIKHYVQCFLNIYELHEM